MTEKNPLLAILSGLGTVLERLADTATTLSEQGPSKPGPRFTSTRGFSMRGLDGSGLDDLKELADRIKNKSAEPIPQKRTLQLEVHAEAKQIVVIVHEPALQAELLQVRIDGDMLELSADQTNAQFHGEALLPCAIDASSQLLNTHSGVIELRWNKVRRARQPRQPSSAS